MTLPGAMLVGISTPHKKSALLFEPHKKAPISAALLCRTSPSVPPEQDGDMVDVIYRIGSVQSDKYAGLMGGGS